MQIANWRLPACQKQSRSGPVSRVLSPPVQKAWAEDGHFSRTPVARRLQQPTRAPGGGPDQPARYCTPVREALPKEKSADALLGLAPGGVCQASRVAPAAGALLPHRFTLTVGARQDGGSRAAYGGLLSVALSRALRPVAVSDHPILWSPDFPLADLHRQRPSGPLRDCNSTIHAPPIA